MTGFLRKLAAALLLNAASVLALPAAETTPAAKDAQATNRLVFCHFMVGNPSHVPQAWLLT